VRVVFDVNGSIVGRIDYGPFGQEITPSIGSQGNIYAGLFVEEEAGLDHSDTRSFQSRTGRFSAVDPIYGGIIEPQRWNRYAYAHNNAQTFRDPSGLNEATPSTAVTIRVNVQGCVDNPYDPVCQVLAWSDQWWSSGSWTGGAIGSSDYVVGLDPGSGTLPRASTADAPPTDGPPTSPPQSPPTGGGDACENYTEFLTQTAMFAGSGTGGPPMMTAGGQIATGYSLMAVGYLDTMQGSTSGFKPVLTAYGQGDDVYRHINFVSGATISGQGLLAVGAFLIDMKQVLFDHRRQSVAELADDIAAFRVAGAFMRAAFTRDYRTFKKQVTKTLCK